MSAVLQLADAEASTALGAALAASLPQRAVLHLHGELGAGKTTLARGLLRALGVTGPVRSPTYTLVERYPTAEGLVLHLDLYRIAHAGELDFLGLDADVAEARLWLVEWPERGAGHLPPPDLELRLALSDGGRRAELVPMTPVGRRWCASL
jgi:tRNA threonylcarbamoyl adenosine modification protein YjeE